MKSLTTLLVANRGEIAVRLIKSAKLLGVRTIAIYTEPDSASQHVASADKAFLLEGSPTTAYLDGDQIIAIAKDNGADAIIPGYGFLSENADFARKVSDNGLHFVGPSPESIESFGLKHTARELATMAGVPIVPGTGGLMQSEEDAVREARNLGFPVMMKATAGGGGMGLLTCTTEEEVRRSFQTVQSRGEALFKNSGLFIERYYPSSHHIEVQIFGNGQGKAVSIGERECSIQRRHQKVIEECPSPFVERKYPDLRQKLTSAAVRLAESVNYSSAGTIEYLVDDNTGSFFFLEMNTRLQVEHGITELCYGVDLVELMLRQTDAQISGLAGLPKSELEALQERCLQPAGHAIELRVYAENPARDYAPSPGLLQDVHWHELSGTRVDTWVRRGITITPNYDPLLAKLMHHAPTRELAIEQISEVVRKSSICGPPTNLDFLQDIIADPTFKEGNTITKFLETFQFSPPAIDVISGGAQTLIQDHPGRPTIGRGFGHAGPMDPVAFQIANALVGNPSGKEGLEITLSGPELLFLGDSIIALCGPPIKSTLDGKPVELWTRLRVRAGQKLAIGKIPSNEGCRVYLAVYGGFPNVAEWFGSKATCPMVGVGGYQGRALASGDLLRIAKKDSLPTTSDDVRVPSSILPRYSAHWDILAMAGPYDEGFLSPESIAMLYQTKWEVSHNAARGGIRLIGPKPKWARSDGGEGGAHPSNIVEYGYPVGTMNWTGDEPVLFPVDCPDFGGFVSSLTVIKGEYWKLGQLKSGNTVQFHRVSLDDALKRRKAVEDYIRDVVKGILSGSFEHANSLENYEANSRSMTDKLTSTAVVLTLEENLGRPRITYRQGADDFILVEYGNGGFDLNNKARATELNRKLRTSVDSINFENGLLSTVGCSNTLLIYYDGTRIAQRALIRYLCSLEDQLGDLRAAGISNRVFRLPLTFRHKKLDAAIERYMANQRPYASYLPDTFDFVAKNNGMCQKELKKLFLDAEFVVVGVGFFTALPLCLPADPRHRIQAPKMNPSRTFTPEGTVSYAGSCMAIYTVDSPGGYQMTGMTLPSVDILGYKKHFSISRPWLFEDMDVITFYEVSEDDYDRDMALYRSGRYTYQISDSEFHMRAHNALLQTAAGEAADMRPKQDKAQERMLELENKLLDKWATEKSAAAVPLDSIQALLEDPDIEAIEAPVNANVWKVLVKQGDTIEINQVVTILEAMKMEINVNADERLVGCVIEKVLIQPNDIVQAGKPLMLVRKSAKN